MESQLSASAAVAAMATSSKEQRNLASAERKPVQIPLWLLQAKADLRVLQAAKQPKAFCFNIDAMPPSWIPSTSSSKARSPTLMRVLWSNVRDFTPSPTKSNTSHIVERISERRLSRSSDEHPVASLAARLYITRTRTLTRSQPLTLKVFWILRIIYLFVCYKTLKVDYISICFITDVTQAECFISLMCSFIFIYLYFYSYSAFYFVNLRHVLLFSTKVE